MTKTEYQSWKEETERSRTAWTIDEIRRHNTGDLFFYKGGENGHFVEVKQNGLVLLGTYGGAIPHIGEALFYTKHERQYRDQNEALTIVIERAGLSFLLDFAGVPERL